MALDLYVQLQHWTVPTLHALWAKVFLSCAGCTVREWHRVHYRAHLQHNGASGLISCCKKTMF